MSTRYRGLIVLPLLLAVPAGCAQGPGPSAARPAASIAPAGPAVAPRREVPVTIVIRVPPPDPGLKAAYVSSATRSITFSVNGGAPAVTNVTGGPNTYTVTVRAPEGTDTFLVKLFDSGNGTGNLLSSTQIDSVITAGKSNVLQLTTAGVPTSIQLSLNNSTPVTGSPATLVLTVAAKDADGNTIVGTYSQSVTLTNSDQQGAIALASTTVTGPATVNVSYTGANISMATLGATSQGISSGQITSAVVAPILQGVVTTLAGSTPGYADASGAAARFNNPDGVAVDTGGNLYVADNNNNVVRRITPAGLVTTYAGDTSNAAGSADGTGTNGTQFNHPAGLTIDLSGNLFLTEITGNRVRKILASSVVTSTVAGSGLPGSPPTNGPGPTATFSSPVGIVMDGLGNLLVADSDNSDIRKITPAAVVTTLAGNDAAGTADGSGTNAQFSKAQGVAFGPSGDIYVADTLNSTIRQIDAGTNVFVLAGGTPGGLDATGPAAQFTQPVGIAVASNGTIYVADTGNHSIRRITANGVVTTVAGNLANSGTADGTGAAARFTNPRGITVDSNGVLYVVDTGNNRVRVIR